MNVNVGDRVRSFDFPSQYRELEGPDACYVEGTVRSIDPPAFQGHYEVVVEVFVFKGKRERVEDGERFVYPPINGRPQLFRRGETNGVEVING
jgi:hypothetical protein